MPKALNWYTDPDRVMDAMVLMEGECWGAQQDGSEFTLPHAIAQLMTQQSRGIAWQDGAETVYGDGGCHRYFLRGDGRVDFSRGRACPVFTDKVIRHATSFGFYIF
jgi:hypothetical protein